MKVTSSTARGARILALTSVLSVGAWAGGAGGGTVPGSVEVGGTTRQWQIVTLTFTDAQVRSETDALNPFTDLRLNVRFERPDGTSLVVPGFFAADGDAAETSAESGDKWRVRLLPDQNGSWTWTASFRTGPGIATELDFDTSGAPVAGSFDGATGTLNIRVADPKAPGNYARGLLQDVGGHHLRFAENGEYYLKGGANSPENLLGYYEFDNTYDLGDFSPATVDGLHHFDAHLVDFDASDPVDQLAVWQGSKGARLAGAINYLASKGVNSMYFLTYNSDGDGTDTWVWRQPFGLENFDRFDVSKLAQWERIFSHMDRRGIQMHVVLQEFENDDIMGGLTTPRKLYFREVVARFAHHPALIWNIGEENQNTVEEQQQFADYIATLDPYDHPMTVHPDIGEVYQTYEPLYTDPNFNATSIQSPPNLYNDITRNLRDLSASNGNPWAIYADEQFSPSILSSMGNLGELRREALWGNFMAGGAGVEWFFDFGDVTLEDFRFAEPLWEDTGHAVHFFQTYLHFWNMESDNSLTTQDDDFVLYEGSETWAVYRPHGGGANLALPDDDVYQVHWYDPRNGGALQTGSLPQVTGLSGDPVWIGAPPSAATEDWVALVRRKANQLPVITLNTATPDPVIPEDPFLLRVRVTDPDGPDDIYAVGLLYVPPVGGLNTDYFQHQGGDLWVLGNESLAGQPTGLWIYAALVVDRNFKYSLDVNWFTLP